MGREGGRGGGGGGVGLTDDGVAGRTGEEEPAEENRSSSRASNISSPQSYALIKALTEFLTVFHK